jgi:hypothetical protein
MLAAILKFLGGGIVSQFTGPLLEAYKVKLAADGDQQKLAAQRDIDAISAARDIAVADLQHRWSATAIGRMLIVLPFGLWWSAIFLIQIINPWFGLSLVVVAVPPDIMAMANVLIPAIVIGDAGTFIASRFRR